MASDIQETTIQIDHTNKTVNFYTTRRSVFLQLLKRNPNYTQAKELEPGYEVDYPIDQIRAAAGLLKPAEGSAEGQFLTDQEKIRRQQTGERLKKLRQTS
jgi:hypothetical protein